MSFRYILAALMLSFCVACGSSDSSTSPTPTPTPAGSSMAVTIVSGASTMTTTAYSPNPVTVAVGGSVRWTNNDSTAHTATADNAAWNSGSLAPGGTFTQTFPTAGTFPYHCTIHPGMVGTVVAQ